jgi:hypothetical protein
MRFPLPFRAAALAVALAASACGTPPYTPVIPVGGPVDFTIDGLSFHISSGGVFTSGQQFTVFFTNQPDTCTAVGLIPQQIFLSLALKISPPADGARTASIGPPSPIVFPPSGTAGGTLSQLQPLAGPPYQVATKVLASTDGSVAWQANASGSVTITRLDMGFAGTPDRVTFVNLTVPICN